MQEGVELGLHWCQCWRAGIRERALLSLQRACGRYLQSGESSDGLKAASSNVNAWKMWGQRVSCGSLFSFSRPVALQMAS